MAHSRKKPAPVAFLYENSLFLIAGALGALIWANVDAASYHHFINLDLLGTEAQHETAHPASESGHAASEVAAIDSAKTATHVDHPAETGAEAEKDASAGRAEKAETEHAAAGHHGFTISFLINDILMALFFAIAAKEVWEAMLPGGALSNPKKAATPLMATLGGVMAPAGVYMAGVFLTGETSLTNGWAIPCATDIAFSYLVARLIFGQGHPAIAFLLLLAIADDAAGLIILAVAYPSGPLALEWLGVSAAAVALCFAFRKFRIHTFWTYLLVPGVMSWFAFYKAGIHPALGLVPIIPALPHANTDVGLFAREELNRDDTLNEFEHWWKDPVELILGLFGLVNAGVAFSSVGHGTWLVLAGLLIGKPVGITLFTWIAQKCFRLEIPGGMSYRHIVTLGMVAAIGFTVALFVSTAAFGGGKAPVEVLDATKMGALGSFGAAIIAILVGRSLGIRPQKSLDDALAEVTPENPSECDDGANAANSICVAVT
ncbi:sodium:proton antiporter [bacterium]|nr:sodium:proton antiporter [bacterium]